MKSYSKSVLPIGLLIMTLFETPATVAQDVEVPPLYSKVGREFKINPVIIYSIALTESLQGKGVKHPWPWSVNDRGTAHWFATKEEAVSFCEGLVEKNVESFDVGLMQMNWRWHKERFASLDEAFTPIMNLRAGTRFLQELYSETGSLETAVGYYHNRADGVRAQYYKNRVRRKMKLVLSGKFQ